VHINPRTDHGNPGEVWKHGSNISSTSTLDVLRGQLHTPAALPSERHPVPMYMRLGGSMAVQGGCGKFRLHSEIRFPDGPVRSASLYRSDHILLFRLKERLGATFPQTLGILN
jgi:hypothetical protein